jgi:O-antigen/teichoic acid export membrane protein/SAM-dependent methyltransferase
MSIFQRTATGFLWNHLGRIGEFALMYLFSVLVARMLGAEINGVYALVLSVVQILLLISSLGLETAVTSHFPKLLQNESKDAAAVTMRSLLMVRLGTVAGVLGVFVFLRYSVGDLLNAPPLFYDIAFLLAAYFSLRSIVSLLTSFQISRLNIKGMALAAIALRVLEVVGSYLVITSGYGLPAVMTVIIVTSATQIAVLGFLLREFLLVSAGASDVRPIISSSWRFWLNSIAEFVLGRHASVILLSLFAVAPFAIGQFDVALGFGQVLNFGLTTGLYGISVVSFSYLSTIDRQALPRYWEFLSRMVVYVVVPVFVFAIGFADRIIPLIYSGEYVPSVVPFQVMGVFLVLTRFLAGGVAGDYLLASRETGALLRSSLVGGGVNVALAVVLIPRLGILGVVYSSGIALLVMASMQAYHVRGVLDVRVPIRQGISMGVLGLITLTLVKMLSAQVFGDNLLILAFLYGGIFIALSYATKPLSSDDAEYLRRYDERLFTLVREFAAMENVGGDPAKKLVGQEKWAYSWLPQSGVVVDVRPTSDSTSPTDESVVALAVLDGGKWSVAELPEGNSTQSIRVTTSRLPFSSGSVDAVLMMGLLDRVLDEKQTIVEVQRILRPGGRLVLSVPNRGLIRLFRSRNLESNSSAGSFATPGTRSFSDIELTRMLFLRFRILEKHYGGLFLYPLASSVDSFVRDRLRWNWSKPLNKLGDIDNDISWGRWSYSVTLVAEKI